MSKGASFFDCGVCGAEFLGPTVLASEMTENGYPVCHRCDTHSDYCDHCECVWVGSNVFCESCEHDLGKLEMEGVVVGE